MRSILFTLFLLGFSFSTNAQVPEGGESLFGLKFGYLTSTLKGIENSVLPIEHWPIERQYSKEYWLRKPLDGFSIDGFFHYRTPFDVPFTGQLEFSYTRLGGGVSMDVDSLYAAVPFEVSNEFVYDYLNTGFVLNFHPGLIGVGSESNGNFFSGFHISGGIFGGIPFPGREQVRYTSNDPREDADKIGNVKRMLTDHFQGKPFWGLVGGVGFGYYCVDSNFGFCIDGRFVYGISDAIHTYPHEFPHYVDDKVRSMAFVGTVGVMCRILKHD